MFTPSGKWQNLLMEMVGKELNIKILVGSEREIQIKLRKKVLLCGVIFKNNEMELPKFLNYSLSFPDSFQSESENSEGDRFWITRMMDIPFNQKERDPDDMDVYYKEGFLTIQNTIFLKYLDLMFLNYRPENYTNSEFRIDIKQMPFPKDKKLVYKKTEGYEWLDNIFFTSVLIPLFHLAHVRFL